MTSVLSDFFEKALRRGGGIFYHTIIELNNENQQFNILTINNILPWRLGMPDNTVSLAFLTGRVYIKCKHRVSLHPKMHMATGHIHLYDRLKLPKY